MISRAFQCHTVLGTTKNGRTTARTLLPMHGRAMDDAAVSFLILLLYLASDHYNTEYSGLQRNKRMFHLANLRKATALRIGHGPHALPTFPTRSWVSFIFHGCINEIFLRRTHCLGVIPATFGAFSCEVLPQTLPTIFAVSESQRRSLLRSIRENMFLTTVA